MKPQNQKEEILLHLMENNTITSFDAIKEYNITRLADKIYLLRKEGFRIESELKNFTNKFGNVSGYAIYKLIG